MSSVYRVTELRDFSEYQQAATSTLVMNYKTRRYCMLIAEMQSGKTTVYMFTACEMLRLGSVKQILIFSGNAEIELKTQTVAIVNGTNGGFWRLYRKYLRNNLSIRSDEVDIIVDEIKKNMDVLWRNDLEKYKKDIRDTLLIWDESHYAQDTKNKTGKFLIKHSIDVSGGDEPNLVSKNNYVLSVSATPFSEFSDNIHHKQGKPYVFLKNSPEYVSVKSMLNNGQIKGYNNSWQVSLETALKDHLDVAEYAIVRSDKKKLEYIQFLCNKYDIECLSYISDETVRDVDGIDAFDLLMSTSPRKLTVIVIYQMLKMGKVLKKDHVCFGFETCTTSNTDTYAQGLLGRFCGYHPYNEISLYIPQKVIESHELNRYIAFYDDNCKETGIQIMPLRANNLIEPGRKQLQGVKQNKHGLYPIIPIRCRKEARNIDNSEEIEYIKANKFALNKNMIKDLLLETRCENFNTTKTTREVVGQLDDFDEKNVIFKFIDDATVKQPSYKEVPRITHDLFSNKTAGGFGTSSGIPAKGGKILIWCFEKSFPQYDIKIGDIFIDARTRQKPVMSLAICIPETTQREVFCRKLETGEELVDNGSFNISLKPETARNVVYMYNTIDKFVEMSLIHDDVINYPSQIVSNCSVEVQKNLSIKNKWHGILVSHEVVDALQPNGAIFLHIQQKYNLQLSITFATSKTLNDDKIAKSGLVRLAKISW